MNSYEKDGMTFTQSRNDDGTFSRFYRVKCTQCQACVINGVACHETGCYNSRKQNQEDQENG